MDYKRIDRIEVSVPNKIARRIKVLASQLKQREKKHHHIRGHHRSLARLLNPNPMGLFFRLLASSKSKKF